MRVRRVGFAELRFHLWGEPRHPTAQACAARTPPEGSPREPDRVRATLSRNSRNGVVKNALRQCRAGAGDGFLQVPSIHFDTHEADAKLGARDRGGPQPEERIGHRADSIDSMEAQAHLGEFRWKRRGMRALFL